MLPWLDLYAPILALLALLAALASLAWGYAQSRRVRDLQARYLELTADTSGGSLESVLATHLENVRAAVDSASAAKETAMRIERSGRQHVQHVSVVRYNPFSHTGGDQSFVLALADGDGNGALINSLHARDGTRIYARPLVAWETAHALTEEEQEAIDKARG